MKYFIPGALLVLCMLSFAPLVPWLGFYWDDWPAIWFFNSLGASGFQQVFAVDRPQLAWLFQVTTPIMRESTVGWQFFGIATRWINAVALWWFLSLLFPRWKKFAAIAAVLFVIYPGFQQQYVSVTYSHGFILSTIFTISLGLMALAARNPTRLWPMYILSLLLSGFVLFTVEYYFGLELLRPVILWIVLSEKYNSYGDRIKKTILYWSPYVLLLFGFLIYTVFFHETPRGQIRIFDILASNPISGSFYLLTTIIQDLFEASFFAWVKTFDLRRLIDLNPINSLIFILITLLTASLTYFFILRLETFYQGGDKSANTKQKSGAQYYILLGIISLLVAGWPFWATDLQLKLRFPLDRFTLPMIMGVSLLITGLIEYIFQGQRFKSLVIGILAGLAVGTHFLTGLTYIQEWELQKEFFRQLTWRAPGIKPATLLLTPELPFTYYSDNSLTAPLNWTYDPYNRSPEMSFLILNLESRLGDEITNFDPENKIQHDYRAKTFTGNLSDTLLFSYQPPRCVAIYDPEIKNQMPQSDYLPPGALLISNLDRIILDANPPATPPEHIFRNEPEHDWCFYFQKAELARQEGNWERVVELGDQAQIFMETLDEKNIDELLPFIEGYARVGQLAKSIQLSERTFQLAPVNRFALCATWDRIHNIIQFDEDHETFKQLYQTLQCESQ